MNAFVASNGHTIIEDAPGETVVRDRSGLSTLTDFAYLDSADMAALREFFRAEEDERLGRWRSTLDAAWTAAVDAETGWVTFRHEDGLREFMVESRRSSLGRWTLDLQRIAREYFDAHPEPKPWRNAEPGEVWLLYVDGVEECVRVLQSSDGARFFPIADDQGMTYGRRSAGITSGRRIWPEDVS